MVIPDARQVSKSDTVPGVTLSPILYVKKKKRVGIMQTSGLSHLLITPYNKQVSIDSSVGTLSKYRRYNSTQPECQVSVRNQSGAKSSKSAKNGTRGEEATVSALPQTSPI